MSFMTETISPPDSPFDGAMSTTERLKRKWMKEEFQRGIQRGFQQGVQQGVQQTKIQMILSLSRRSFTPGQIADMLSLEIVEVERALAPGTDDLSPLDPSSIIQSP